MAAYVSTLQSWGFRVDIADHALDELGYMAGSDRDRLDDLNRAFADPEVRAIITTRGGAGAYRIADGIDIAAVTADPKPIVGFSDISYLHLAILKRAGVGGVHGCLVGPTARASVRRLLTTTESLSLRSDPTAVSAPVSTMGSRPVGGSGGGVAQGPLVGGNLTSLATSVGSRLPALAGAILFIEDQRTVGLGTVDRQLTQLISSGSLDGLVGVALGSFEGFRGYRDRGWGIVDVLTDRLWSLGIPVLGGLFAGHDLTAPDGSPDQSALPLGSQATLDVAAAELSVAPIVH